MDLRAFLLWLSANSRLANDKPFIIAITGSIAKTSTKEAVGAVLKRAYGESQVRVGYGNLNTYLGLPMAILGFKVDFYKQKISWQWPFILLAAIWRSFTNKLPKYLVIEMGADKPGDLAELLEHITPDIGIITLVGEAHLMNYESSEQLGEEKGNLAQATKPSGLVLLNRNDPFFKTHLKRSRAQVVEFECPTAEIAHRVAELVGKHLKIDPKTIGEALLGDWRPAGRLQHISGRYKVIDDSYNASPVSMRAALEELSKMPKPRVAILGSMLELGSQEVKFHEEVGIMAHQLADKVIGVGELAKHYKPDKWYPTSAEAADKVVAELPEAASILVKGSHGIRTDHIVEALH
ncbi:MAG: hypothetical protein HZB70_00065 [Candidatus Berkelbacteria bacterium]|nr:MAG: hypothetical protein HZB70_00065 [Candidatus Berkelbacteria bacterium]QQG51492.1 MAG: hypothetical protein HY845_02935 [Candidatus Berkelbacteria bacterium]